MSFLSTKRLWSSISRKLVNRGNLAAIGKLADAQSLQKLKVETRKLKEAVRMLKSELRPQRHSTSGQPADASAGFSPDDPLSEKNLFSEALRLRALGDPLAAMRLLERHHHLASEADESFAFQAALALSLGSEDQALALMKASVDSAQPEHATLFWGPDPIISNAYWSKAMRSAGIDSKSLMWLHYPINNKEDFDLYVADIMPEWLPASEFADLAQYGALPHCLAFLHLIRHAKIVHLPFSGSFLGQTDLWRHEADLLRRAGIKTVLLPYGGDYYCYSRIQDPCVRYALLANYPGQARRETAIQERLSYWQQEADCVLCGYMLDAIGRWDVTVFNFFHIDTDLWQPKPNPSHSDGVLGTVKIVHTPNHRGFKGTEFLLDAVTKLQAEGLMIDLRLLEGVPNAEVRRVMSDSDIVAEQFVATAYAMSGIEGMATGLPVMSNLHDEYYTRIYRRYSFLNECPILSTTPENLQENLRLLVTRPKLRHELGSAGRKYVEKYHSFEAARFLFGKIHASLHGEPDDTLLRLFHPLLSEHAKSNTPIVHPLIENRLPEESPFRL